MAARRPANSISRRMPELPTNPDDTVPFAHSAAGHEGISTSASGSTLIKPCTQAEIDFYQSAQEPGHEYFRVHMPEFYGVINLAPTQNGVASILNQQGGIAPMTALQQPAITSNSPPAPIPGHLVHAPTTTSLSVKRSSGNWKPSGGKKLETGLAIALENAAAGMKYPCILDVKLGARLWDDDAPAAKRQKLDDVAKDSTSGSLGFRVAGMKVWLGDDESVQTQNLQRMPSISKDKEHYTLDKDGYVGYDKLYGRTFDKDNVKDAFITYLGGLDENEKLYRKHARMIRDRLISNLRNIEFVLQESESRMYSASILMVYEGNDEYLMTALKRQEDEESLSEARKRAEENGQETSEDEEAESDDSDYTPPKVHDVKLIDFAHARFTPGQGPDENALQGVRNVIKILKEIK